MNHPLDWQINYCLLTIEHLLDETEHLEFDLAGIPPAHELSLEDKWKIRETLQGIRCQVKILQEDITQLEAKPTKKKFIRKLMRK